MQNEWQNSAEHCCVPGAGSDAANVREQCSVWMIIRHPPSFAGTSLRVK